MGPADLITSVDLMSLAKPWKGRRSTCEIKAGSAGEKAVNSPTFVPAQDECPFSFMSPDIEDDQHVCTSTEPRVLPESGSATEDVKASDSKIVRTLPGRVRPVVDGSVHPDGHSLEFGKVSILKRQDSLGDIDETNPTAVAMDDCNGCSGLVDVEDLARQKHKSGGAVKRERRVQVDVKPKSSNSSRRERTGVAMLKDHSDAAYGFTVEHVPEALIEALEQSELSSAVTELTSSIITGVPVTPLPGGFSSSDISKPPGGAGPSQLAKPGGPGPKKSASAVIKRLGGKFKTYEEFVVWLTAGEKVMLSLARAVFRQVEARLGESNLADFDVCRLLSAGASDKVLLHAISAHSVPLATVMRFNVYGVWETNVLTGRAARVSDDTKIEPSPTDDKQDDVSPGLDAVVEVELPEIVIDRSVINVMVVWNDSRFEVPLANAPATVADAIDTLNRQMSIRFGNGRDLDGWGFTIAGKRLDVANAMADYNWNSFIRVSRALPGGSRYCNIPDTFDEISAGTDTLSSIFMRDQASTGRYIDLTAELTARCGLTNAGGLSVNTNDQLLCRGTGVRDTGVNDAVTLPNPVSLLKPQNFFVVGEDNVIAPEQVDRGLDGYVVASKLCAQHGTSTRTAMADTLQDLTARAGSIRPDAITPLMFGTTDSVQMMYASFSKAGDAMTSQYLKLQLYEYIHAWRGSSNVLPLASEAGQFDANASLTPPYAPPTFIYDDDDNRFDFTTSTVQVAGGSRYFPFSGLEHYTITFHVSLTSVPLGKPFYAVPNALLTTCDAQFPSLTYALMAMALAPYPCGIWTLRQEMGAAGSVDVDIKYSIPWANGVAIDGETDLHLLLPRRIGRVSTTTQADANGSVAVRPRTGPSGGNATLQANSFLQISYNDNAGIPVLTSYRMADYLHSWLKEDNSPIDITTLATFRKQLALLTGRYRDLRFCQEFAALLACRFPATTVRNRIYNPDPFQQGGFYLNGDEVSWASQNFFGVRPHLFGDGVGAGYDFGSEECVVPYSTVDFYIPALSPIWWNQVVMGLIQPNVDDSNFNGLATDGNPQQLNMLSLIALNYAVVTQALFTYYAFPASVWNTAYTNIALSGIGQELRRLFAQGYMSGADGSLCSDLGMVLESVHRQLNECDPAMSSSNLSVWSIISVPKDGFLPIVQGQALLDDLCPCVLCDYYVQMVVKIKVYEFMGFVSVNKGQRGLMAKDAKALNIQGNIYSVPYTAMEVGFSISNVDVPTVDALTNYTKRLIYSTYQCRMYDLRGNEVVAVDPLFITTRKPVPRDGFVGEDSLYNVNLLMAATNTFPHITDLGERIYLCPTTGPNSAAMTRIVAGLEYARLAVWAKPSSMIMGLTIITSGTNQRSRLRGRVLGNGSGPSGSGSEGPPPPGDQV